MRGLPKTCVMKLYALVKSGKSDSEITHYLTERYGDFILFKPPVKILTILLWFWSSCASYTRFYYFGRACWSHVMVTLHNTSFYRFHKTFIST